MGEEGEERTPKWNLLHVAFASLVTVVGVDTFTIDHWLVYKNGGSGTYCLVYYLSFFLLFLPLAFVHMKLGGATERGLVGMFAKHVPILTGAGFAQVIYCLLTIFCFAPFACSYLFYMALTVVPGAFGTGDYTGRYPWSTCDNEWNTPNCFIPAINSNDNSSTISLSYSPGSITSEDEFYRFFFGQGGPSLDGLGGMDYPLPVCLLISWIIVALMTVFGTKIYGWLLSGLGLLAVTTTLTVIIFGYQNVPEKAIAGLYPYFYYHDVSAPDTLNENLWLMCITKIVFSMNLVLAFMPAMGKFLGNGNIKNNVSWLFVVFAVLIKPHVGLNFVIPYLAALSSAYDIPVNEVILPGPEFAFVTLPSAFSAADYLPPAILFLMYLTIFLFAIAFISMCVVVITDAIKETFTSLSGKFWLHVVLTCCLCVFSFLLGLPMVTRNRIMLFTTVDLFLYALSMIVFLFTFIGLAITYVKMEDFHIIQRILVVVWFGVCSLSLFGLLIAHVAYDPPDKYLKYIEYETYIHIGWLVACTPIVIGLPLGVVYAFLIGKGSMGQRVNFMFCGEPPSRNRNDQSTFVSMNQSAYPRQANYQRAPVEEKTGL